MTLSDLSTGSRVVVAAGVLLLIDSFLHWQEVSFGPFSAGVSMWHGWGVVLGLVLLAILAWNALQIAGITLSGVPLSPTLINVVLAAFLVLFALIKVLADDYVTVWAWIGLILSGVLAAGAWSAMRAVGESLADLRARGPS